MSSHNYSITEPHPSVPASHYFYSGRGGAGNVSRVNPQAVTAGPDATGPAARISLQPTPSSAYFGAGRGGAGNMHREKERAIFSFDEELQRQQRLLENQAPVYHIGRGGAGNLIDEMEEKRRSSHSSSGSTSSAESGVRRSMDSAWNRVRGAVSRH